MKREHALLLGLLSNFTCVLSVTFHPSKRGDVQIRQLLNSWSCVYHPLDIALKRYLKGGQSFLTFQQMPESPLRPPLSCQTRSTTRQLI